MKMRPTHSWPRYAPIGAACVCSIAAFGGCDGPTQQPFFEDDIQYLDSGDAGSQDGAGDGSGDARDDAAFDAGDTLDAVDGGPEVPTYDGIPSFVEVTLSPLRALYLPGSTATLSGLAYDEAGEPMPEVELVWTADPPEAATAGDDGAWVLNAEGPVSIAACVRYPRPGRPAVCGRKALMVDGSPPIVEVTRPLPGEMIRADGDDSIRVAGRVTDTNGSLQVFVNGDRVAIGSGGQFTAAVPARFGVNHIEVVGTDGLQVREGRQALDVIWAPDYLPVNLTGDDPVATRVDINNAVRLEMRQSFLDDGIPLVIPSEGTLVTADDIASVLELVLREVDLLSVIPNPVADSAELTLAVDAATIGPAAVEVVITDAGLDIFVGLSAIAVDTTGRLDLGGAELNLDGGLDASIAASLELNIVKERDAELRVEVAAVRLALEGASGRFVSPEANAVLDVVEGLLFQAVEGFLVDAIEEAFVSQVPTLLEGALGSVDTALQNIELPLDLGFGPPATLQLNGALATIDSVRRQRLTAVLDLGLGALGAPTFADAPGIPIERPIDAEPEPFTGGRAAVLIPLAVINGVLYSVWNAGLLELDVSDQIPESLSILVDAVELHGALPPLVTQPDPDRADEFDLVLHLGQLEVTLGRGEQRDVLGMNLSAGVRVVVDGTTLRVELEEEPRVEAWTIAVGGSSPIFADAGALEPIIRTTLWTELTASLTDSVAIPLPSLAFDAAASFAPRLQDLALQVEVDRGIELRDGFVYVYGGLEGQADLAD